ncbi:hypothetical protein DL95DRAFT_460977 [Leptodontidium sp. 2 PMI_412]|nr:hypothetical protein DL95DRAFT_460977 [Leptodontidium sp. 2 PMI_412]
MASTGFAVRVFFQALLLLAFLLPALISATPININSSTWDHRERLRFTTRGSTDELADSWAPVTGLAIGTLSFFSVTGDCYRDTRSVDSAIYANRGICYEHAYRGDIIIADHAQRWRGGQRTMSSRQAGPERPDTVCA